MSINIRIGIALYSPRWDPAGGRHWALALNTSQNRLSGKVHIYQAIEREGVWLLSHLDGILSADEYYYGVLDLGVVRGSEDIVLGIIEEFEATQDEYGVPGGKVWSCAWWVIRALRAVQDVYPGAMKELPGDDLGLYELVVGRKAEEMKCAPGPLHQVGM